MTTEHNNGVKTYSPDGQIVNKPDPIEVDEDFAAPKALLKAQSLANTLDTAVKIPFIGLRVGLDSLVGLIPGIGDTIMLLASIRIIYLGHKLGVPSDLRTIMIRNSLIDYGLGFVPLLGDIVDIFFKANLRNVRIMEKWWVSQNKDKIDALTQQRIKAWEGEQKQA
ncbi:DUF4112 domain-containing protein [Glaciecola sp. 2405UD65-10]|uniref:DUF4112 domain-containing protein n=1 Tax=Glaciecola sp. 2405UD65-10 TaxID=3397244 RepID=UPI003B59A452